VKLLDAVVKEHTPTPAEMRKLNAVIREVLSAIRGELARRNIRAEVMLGGSAAKRTFLKHDFDCDCFVRFAPTKQDISDITEKVLARFPDVERVPGSRDYFQFELRGVAFEIVPVMKVDSHKEVRNVTDASPLHVGWIMRHLRRKPALRRDILLLKLLLKANDLYGAESYIRAFSGHVVDLLVLAYGGFPQLARAAAQWKPGVIIDVERHHQDAHRALNPSKHGPLMLVDPVQPERNAAAALSEENFLRFTALCRAFLKRPTKGMFSRKELSESELRRKAGERTLLLVDLAPKRQKRDIMGAKCLKVHHFLRASLEKHGFLLEDSGWRFLYGKESTALLWYILSSDTIETHREHAGPPLSNTKHADIFRKKHDATYEREGKLYARVKRKHTSAAALVRELLAQPEVTGRVSRAALRSRG